VADGKNVYHFKYILIMHEWALAEAVASFVHEKVKKPERMKIRLGELQNIDEEIFLFALKELIGQVDVEIENEECTLRCNVCKKEIKLKDINEEEREMIHFLPEAVHAFVSCPFCGSKDFSIEKGRGVVVESVEG
jgi:hydrogenase nickel incorporation protein HypA/HybF